MPEETTFGEPRAEELKERKLLEEVAEEREKVYTANIQVCSIWDKGRIVFRNSCIQIKSS